MVRQAGAPVPPRDELLRRRQHEGLRRRAFVTSGLQFNLRALVSSAATVALVPVFFAALLVIRGLPAVMYRPALGTRKALAAGMLQVTSLGFIVVAAQIGMELGMLTRGTGAALIAVGLLSVMIFPLAAVTALGRVDAADPETRPGVPPAPAHGA
jgi:Kef-type K+ transport system membrane component KefB